MKKVALIIIAFLMALNVQAQEQKKHLKFIGIERYNYRLPNKVAF